MKFIQYGRKSVQTVLLGAVLTALFSCSSEPVNPPAELQDFEPQTYIKRLWKAPVGIGDNEQGLALSPVLSDGKLYTVDTAGLLVVTDPRSGKRLRKQKLEDRVLGGLGVDQLCLYYTSFQGDLVCIERETGNPRWRRKLAAEIVAPPVSNNRVVVVHTIDGKVIAHDASEGNQLWRYDNIGGPLLTLRGNPSPVLANGQVISAFADGELIAFDERTGQIQWKVSLAVSEGRTELERLVDADGRPVIVDNLVYGVAYQGNVIAVDRRSGSEVWSKPVSSFNGLAVDDESLYLTVEDGTVMAINRHNSNELWSSDLFSYRRLGTPYLSGNLLFVDDFEGYVHVLLKENGEQAFRLQPDSEGIMGYPVIAGDYLFYYARDGYLVAYKIYR